MSLLKTSIPSADYPWTPDDAHGGYVNPVLFADYSDPDAIRVGDDYWLTASSFNCTPGLPILHSKDLVNWTIVNHALTNLPDPSYSKVLAGCGVWAPSIRYHANQYWIFFPTPDEGIYFVKADDPLGAWSEPHLVQAGKGLIDPCPLWDADGKAYLVFAYAGSRAGIKNRLDIREMDPAGKNLIGPAHTVLNDPKTQPTAEGPKFYKRNGWYYIFCPAGGVESGWQLVLRSKSVLGPYEHRKVLAQGDTLVNGPHQGALVDCASGKDWFIHFQELLPYGRIVHLQPVTWTEDWPLIGESSNTINVGKPVRGGRKPVQSISAPVDPATSDDFEQKKLGLQWQWHANHGDDWYSLSDRPGWLRLRAMPLQQDNAGLTPHLLLQKFPAAAFDVHTRLEIATPQTAAGIVVAGRASATWLLHRDEQEYQVRLTIKNETVFFAAVSGASVELSVKVKSGGECTFSFSADTQRVTAPKTFTAREGVWIGAKIGLVALSNESGSHADFDFFQFTRPAI